jgi:CheY-like chemotaxis protein
MISRSINLRDLVILIAEPSSFMSMLIHGMLRGFGSNKVLEVRDSTSLLRALVAQKIDILICDARLPPHGGLTLTRSIRHPGGDITEVRYRNFKRAALKELVNKRPELFDKLSRACIEEKMRADQLIVDLGRRSAEERIARLILGLADRLAQRGMMQAGSMEMDFPLRQHHIADATGLTPVHVNKLLSEFRRRGLVKIGDRALTILDPAGLRRVAHMR